MLEDHTSCPSIKSSMVSCPNKVRRVFFRDDCIAEEWSTRFNRLAETLAFVPGEVLTFLPFHTRV